MDWTRGGATVIKMVRQNRGAAGAEASAAGTRMEPQPLANFVHFISYFMHSEA